MSKLQFLLNELEPYMAPQKKAKSFTTNSSSNPMLFAVHGTESGPDTWVGSHSILNVIPEYFGFSHSNTTIDAGFNWGLDANGKPVGGGDYRLDWLKNGPDSRKKAADLLYRYILHAYKNKFSSIARHIDQSNWKAIKQTVQQNPIILVAHSHGGNVCMHLLSTLKSLGIKAYLCTLATPVYYDKDENVQNYKDTLFEHAHFWTSSDWVQGTPAWSDEIYVNNFTNNHEVPTKEGHSFQHRNNHPELLATCIKFFTSHKRNMIVSQAFHRTLSNKFPRIIQPYATVKKTRAQELIYAQ